MKIALLPDDVNCKGNAWSRIQNIRFYSGLNSAARGPSFARPGLYCGAVCATEIPSGHKYAPAGYINDTDRTIVRAL